MSGCCKGALKKPGKLETSVIIHLSHSVKPLMRVLNAEIRVDISDVGSIEIRVYYCVCAYVCVFLCFASHRIQYFSFHVTK